MIAVAVVASLAAIMILVELIAPARIWPAVSRWWPRAIAVNAVQVGFVFVAGVTWDRWFPGYRLWDASVLGTWPGALLGYFVITFVYYWWHRARHEIPFLWRWVHQVHHSPMRIEIITSFYKHPIELLINSLLSSFLLYVVVGLDAAAGTLAVTFSGIAELFYHWNVRTPHWIGYFIQRPESHCIHHRRGWHHSNFADLPLWDMLFGTYDNPRADRFDCGFEDPLEHRLMDMLRGRDVHAGVAQK